jgi:cellulose biosynthesis protein BcsQ
MTASSQNNTGTTGRSRPDGDRGCASAGPISIVACAGKGGGGKTSTVVNLAVIAHRSGHRVGIIDGDPQRSSLAWRQARGNSEIPVHPTDPQDLGKAVALARRANLGWLFVDMPPDPSLAIVAAKHADLLLIPLRPALFDLKVTRSLIERLRSARGQYAVVINAAPARRDGEDAPLVREARAALLDIGARLWRRQITHRVGIPYAAVAGAGVAEVEPDGAAASEYSALYASISRLLR